MSGWPSSTPCAISTRWPTCASPASTRASTTPPTSSGSSPCWPRARHPSSTESGTIPHRPQKEEAILGEEVGGVEGAGVLAGRDRRPAGGPAGEERGDRETPLVDQVGREQIAVQRRAALAQGDVVVELGQSGGEINLTVAGPQGVDGHGRRVLGGDDEASPAAEQRQRPVQVGPAGHHADA